MKLQEPTKKILLVIISILLLHSLFPPRIYIKNNTSAGRSLVLSPRFHQADYDAVDTTATNYTIHYQSMVEHNEHITSTWNPATLDIGTYLAETMALLSIGFILILSRKAPIPMDSL